MGKIVSTSTNRLGIKKRTEVKTNNLDEFVIWVAGRFGRKRQWRVIHWIEKKKLRRN